MISDSIALNDPLDRFSCARLRDAAGWARYGEEDALDGP